MSKKEKTAEEKSRHTSKAGLFQRLMERMMTRVMKKCGCGEMMAQMSNGRRKGCCADMMATCCGTQGEPKEETQRS